jgi:hypothetical protein
MSNFHRQNVANKYCYPNLEVEIIFLKMLDDLFYESSSEDEAFPNRIR